MATATLRIATSDAGDSTFFRFFDVTRAYNPTYNPGGYGAPNLAISDVDWATLQVQRRGDTTNTVYTIELFPDMPSANPDFFVTILNTQIGLTADQKIISDIYKLTYSVGHLDSVGARILDAFETMNVALMPQLRCCIKKVRQGMPVPSKDEKCCCENKDITGLANAELILKVVCELVGCDQLDRAEAEMAWLTTYCNCNCKNCN